jgi:GH15 family glucan-1,4-alpha-glucosidase
MPRDIPVSNGNLLIAFDKDYLLREFYFPHIGQESHKKCEPFRFGIWVNGRFCWLPKGWKIKRNYVDDSLVTMKGSSSGSSPMTWSISTRTFI